MVHSRCFINVYPSFHSECQLFMGKKSVRFLPVPTSAASTEWLNVRIRKEGRKEGKGGVFLFLQVQREAG